MTRKLPTKYQLQRMQICCKKTPDTWLLEFNSDKCHVLTLGRLENITHTERYKINGEEFEHVFDEKNLGVTLDYEMTFEQHIK